MDYLCDVFVRPLACKHRDDLWQQRWPDHAHLQVLAECLGLNFRVHNTQNKYYVTVLVNVQITAVSSTYCTLVVTTSLCTNRQLV